MNAKQWTIDDVGPKNLKISEARVEEARGNNLLIRTEAVSLNSRDKLVLERGMGSLLKFPFVPGSDMAGRVEAVGEAVTRLKPGDRVISTFAPDRIEGHGIGSARNPPLRTRGGVYPGVLSEYVTLPESWFVRASATLDPAEASTLPASGLTAWFALVENGKLKAGDIVVVQGTGGVALFALQIAKAHGATVIVTSGSPEKSERVMRLGADHFIDREGWVESVYQLTGDYGADHILELTGGANVGEALRAVAVGGHISVIGMFGGETISGPILSLLLKTPVIYGVSVGHRRALEDLVKAVDSLKLKPVIDSRYRFEALPDALERLGQGPFGKVVIEI